MVLRITEIIVMGPGSLRIKRLLGKVYSLRVIDVVAWTVGDGVIDGVLSGVRGVLLKVVRNAKTLSLLCGGLYKNLEGREGGLVVITEEGADVEATRGHRS